MIFALFARNKKKTSRFYDATDGTRWGLEVRWPSATNAMVVFLYPDVEDTSRNRYAWWIVNGPEARDVTARLDADHILASLTDNDLRALFRKSMPISSQIPRFEPA